MCTGGTGVAEVVKRYSATLVRPLRTTHDPHAPTGGDPESFWRPLAERLHAFAGSTAPMPACYSFAAVCLLAITYMTYSCVTPRGVVPCRFFPGPLFCFSSSRRPSAVSSSVPLSSRFFFVFRVVVGGGSVAGVSTRYMPF